MAISETLGEQRTLEIEDGRIEYRICGQGPTVVFLHGIFANADVWRGVVSDLAADHGCVAPDWPLGAHRLGMRPGTGLLVARDRTDGRAVPRSGRARSRGAGGQ